MSRNEQLPSPEKENWYDVEAIDSKVSRLLSIMGEKSDSSPPHIYFGVSKDRFKVYLTVEGGHEYLDKNTGGDLDFGGTFKIIEGKEIIIFDNAVWLDPMPKEEARTIAQAIEKYVKKFLPEACLADIRFFN